MKTFNSELSYVDVWLTDRNFKPLETKDKVNITLIINQIITYKNGQDIQFNREMKYS